MKWIKSQYLITCKGENEKYRLLVEGIKTDIGGYEIGIHKESNGIWIVTDISTGYQMHITDTQKAAKKWAEETADIIISILSKDIHKQLVKEVEALCSKE